MGIKRFQRTSAQNWGMWNYHYNCLDRRLLFLVDSNVTDASFNLVLSLGGNPGQHFRSSCFIPISLGVTAHGTVFNS